MRELGGFPTGESNEDYAQFLCLGENISWVVVSCTSTPKGSPIIHRPWEEAPGPWLHAGHLAKGIKGFLIFIS